MGKETDSRLALPLAAGGIATTPEVDSLIAAGQPVAIGVSGGKDSCAVAFATNEYLDKVGHTGPRLLIHADLGVTEWVDSLPTCERLAKQLNLELMIVRRPQGDMMERWEQRWSDNVKRWVDLSCVKLILPWSTPSMRFCTAELKVDQICRALSRRFQGQTILNVTGIRRQESSERAKAPIAKAQPKLKSVTRETTGVDWHPIIDWSLDDVWNCLAANAFERHEAYVKFGSSRVSCVYCILATEADHRAGARDERNHVLAHRMVKLEIVSTFAFKGNCWLGDTLTDVLSDRERADLRLAKERGEAREFAEAKIPEHLLYTKGWPTCVPTQDEATLLAAVRFAVADAVGLPKTFIKPVEIITRYEQLLKKQKDK